MKYRCEHSLKEKQLPEQHWLAALGSESRTKRLEEVCSLLSGWIRAHLLMVKPVLPPANWWINHSLCCAAVQREYRRSRWLGLLCSVSFFISWSYSLPLTLSLRILFIYLFLFFCGVHDGAAAWHVALTLWRSIRDTERVIKKKKNSPSQASLWTAGSLMQH